MKICEHGLATHKYCFRCVSGKPNINDGLQRARDKSSKLIHRAMPIKEIEREKLLTELSLVMSQKMTEKLRQDGIRYELKKAKLNLWHSRMILVLFPFEMVVLTVIAYALLFI